MNIGTVEGVVALRDKFTAPLKAASAQLAQFQAQLAATAGGAGVGKLTPALDKAAHSTNNLGRQIRTTLIHVASAAAAYRAVSAAISSVSKQVEFTRTLTRIANTTSATRQEVDEFKRSVNSLIEETGRGPQELADGFNRIASVGITGAAGVDTLRESAKLAAIGLGETNDIVGALASAINAYGKENLTAATAANQLHKAVDLGGAEASEMASVLGRILGPASLLGISFAEVGASIATFTRLGVGADEAVTALRGTIMALLNPSKAGQEALALIGMSMADLRREVREKGLAVALIDLMKAFKGNDEALADIIPNSRALAGFLANAGSQAEAYADIINQVANAHGNVNEALADTMSQPAARMDVLRGKMEALHLMLGETLLPAAEAFGQALVSIDPADLVDLGTTVAAGIQNLAKAMKWVVENIGLLTSAVKAYITLQFVKIINDTVVGLANYATQAAAAGVATGKFSLAVGPSVLGLALTGTLFLLIEISRRLKQFVADTQRDIDALIGAANRAGEAHQRLMNRDVFGRPTDTGMVDAQASMAEAIQQNNDLRASLKLLNAQLAEAESLTGRLTGKAKDGRIPALKAEIAETRALIAQNSVRIKQDRETIRSGIALGTQGDDLRASLAGVNEEGGNTPPILGEMSDAMADAAREARLMAQALALLKKGVDPATVKGLVDAANALKSSTLDSADVRQMAAYTLQVANAASQIELADTNMGNLAKSTAKFGNEVAKAGDEIRKIGGKAFGNIVNRSDGMGNLKPEQDSEKTTESLSASLAAWDAFVTDVAEGTKGAAKTARDHLNDYVEAIRIGMAAGTIEVKDGLAAIRDAQADHARETLSNWTTMLGMLADEFGGFFSYLARLAQALQQGQQFGSSVSGAATSMGASGQMAGMAGSVANVLYVWYQIYQLASDWLKKKKSKKFQDSGTFGLEDGDVFGRASGEFGDAMRDLVRSIEDALRITITDLEEIGIKIRNDGEKFRTYFKGVWVGEFNDMQEAIEAALAMALTDPSAVFGNMTQLMQEALDSWGSANLEGLLTFLGQMREISDLGLPEGAAQMQELAISIQRLFQALMQMPPTAAVADGVGNLIGALTTNLHDLFNLLTGHKDDPKKEAEARAAAYNAQRAIVLAQLQLMRLELEARIAEYRIRLQLLGGLGGLGGPGPGGVTGGRGRRNDGGGVFGAGEAPGSDLSLKGGRTPGPPPPPGSGGLVPGDGGGDAPRGGGPSRGSTGDPGLDALLAALDAILRAIMGLPPALSGEDVKLPRIRGGGGVDRGAERRNIQREVGGFGLGDVAAQIREVNLWLVDFAARIKEAGFSTAETTRLLALAAEEAARRNAEIKQSVIDTVQGLLGIGQDPFSQLRKSFAAAHKQIDEAGFGAARAARMHARLNAALEVQLLALSQQEWLSIGDSLFGFIEKYYGDVTGFDDIRLSMEKLRFTLELENMRARFKLLLAENKLTDQQIADFNKLFNFIDANMPDFGIGDDGPDVKPELRIDPEWLARQDPKLMEELADQMKRARDMLKSYTDQGLSELHRQLLKINEDFTFIRKILGSTAEIEMEHQKAIARAINDWLQPLADARRAMDFGEESVMRGDEQFSLARNQFRDIAQRMIGGELDLRDQFLELAEQYRTLGQGFTGGEGFRFIDKEIKDIFDRILAISPDLKFDPMTNLGIASNPMTTTSPDIKSTLEVGNTLIVGELRTHTTELREIKQVASDMRDTLGNPLDVRNIA